MDTPFGRLDRNHRENVLKHLATMSEQVVILAHSGELLPSSLDSIRTQVDREYFIEHPSSTISYLRENDLTEVAND